MSKPRVYIDMDDTAVDYSTQQSIYSKKFPKYQHPQSIIGFFSNMKPKIGFMEAWKVLGEHYELRFLTRPSIFNINSYSEKAQWVLDHMSEEEGVYVLERLILACHKDEVGYEGDYLVDDWTIHGQTEFRGEFLHFGPLGQYKSWQDVVDYLLDKVGAKPVKIEKNA
jgi:5'(3')-deoxyribonucleotidase